jgi:lysozyme
MQVPRSKPHLSQNELDSKVAALGLDRSRHPFVVAGIRGYYRNLLGAPGVNDRGLYDDALFLSSPLGFASYNGNTDPSRVRKGRGTGAGKGMAVLQPGLWLAHRFGLHRGKYLALVQTGGPVTVLRDGDPPYPDSGLFGINIHRGGWNTTSSLGCQTVHPSQWPAFIALARDLATRHFGAAWRITTIPYALFDG